MRTNTSIAGAGVTAAFTIAAMLAAAARAEDVTIVSKTRFGEKQGTQTVFLSSAKMKTAGTGSDSVVDLATGQMTFLDEQKKTYYITTVEEMAAYAKRREEQAKASGFNTESFGVLGEALAKKTGKTRRIAGHPCDDWTIQMGEGLLFEVCAARDLPTPKGYFEARGAAYAAMGPMGRHFAKMFEAMKKTRGYPLSLAMHVRLESMKQESLTEATEVRRGVPAGAFEIPPDYAKKASPFAGPS